MTDYRVKRRHRKSPVGRDRYAYYARRLERRNWGRSDQAGAAAGQPNLSFEEIIDHDNLLRIFKKLAAENGQAAGPDRVTYRDLSRAEMASLSRDLSKRLRTNTYVRSAGRIVKIPKPNKTGHREIAVRSIVDRVVATAVAEAVGPRLETEFLPCSHGFRADRGTWSMFLDLEHAILEEGKQVITVTDIRQAFDNVPVETAVEYFGRYIKDPKLKELSGIQLRDNTGGEERSTGIDQGSPLSPVALNVLLHHVLDQPLSESAVTSYLRYADDLGIASRTTAEGEQALREIRERLGTVGMSLKDDLQTADVGGGGDIDVLGFNIRKVENRIVYKIPDKSWAALQGGLEECHAKEHPERAAKAVIAGWLEAVAPALPEESERESVVERLKKSAAEGGYRELPWQELEQKARTSADRWKQRKASREGNREQKSSDSQPNQSAPPTVDPPIPF